MPLFKPVVLFVVLFTFSALLPVPAAADPVVQTPSANHTDIGKGIQFLEDSAGKRGIADVMDEDLLWSSNDDKVFNRGYNNSAWWLKIAISNAQPSSHWLLEIAYAVLDHVDAYVVSSTGQVNAYRMGDKRPFQERPVNHRFFLVPLEIPTGDQVTLYLRLKSTSSIQAPMSLWERRTFESEDIGHTALQGIYYGGLLIIALYNLLLYLALGDRNYLYYVGWVLGMLFWMASLNGWAFQFLWPEATQWNDTAVVTLLGVLILFGALFTGRFLNVSRWPRILAWLHYVVLSLSGALVLLSFVLPYQLAIRLYIPFGAFACLWGLFAGFVAVNRRLPSAMLYLVAWSMLLLGGVVLALNKVHLIERSLMSDYAIQIGSLLEVLLLSFALAERINRERSMRLEAQQEAITVQRQANEVLEQRVTERTEALEQANARLKELSDTDQLTGLKNRRFLNQYLDKEFARALRYQHRIAILMIDVDHFKSVNDNYGHQVGDDCLQEVARRIREEMRWPTDMAARYGGEEFCVVLPETTLEGALTVAERIRQKVEAGKIATRALDLTLTISIGAHVGTPESGTNANGFIALADAALYNAKQTGRNRVMHAADPDSAFSES